MQERVMGSLLCLSISAIMAVAQPPPQTSKGFEISLLSIERVDAWRPGDGILAGMAKVMRGDPVKPRADCQFAVVCIRIRVLAKQGKGLVVSKVQVVDADGGKHRWSGGKLSPNDDNWGDRTEEFVFEIPKSTPKLVKLTFEELAFDLEGLGPQPPK